MNTSVSLEGLRLLARGGQSDIYEYGEGRVLRVARRPQDHDRIRYEFSVYQYLRDLNAAVPEAYELLQVDGAPAISMERISGPTLLDQIRHNPLGARGGARRLARLQVELLRVAAGPPILDAKSKARFCIKSSVLLSESQKNAIFSVLEELPDGGNLCHGDFHPGNLICVNKTYYIIDWSAASAGDFHSDVAHTYLLLRNVPQVPGQGALVHAVQKRIGNAIAATYLQEITRELPIDMGTFSRWLLVKAAERTYYGLPSEKGRLTRFITACLDGPGEPAGPNEYYRHL